jgi:tetratricopeptide (TPR) repeat protein
MGSSDAAPGPVAAAWSWAIIAGFVFATLAWDFVVNPQGSRALARILWLSLTSLAARTGTTAFSPGMLYMVGAVVAVGLLLAVVETDTRYWAAGRPVRWGPFAAAWAVAALALPAIYALIQASGLRPNADTTHLIYTYLGLLLAAGAGLAWALSRDKAAVPSAGPAWLAYPVLALAALWLVWPANVSMIRADVYYKNGMRAEGQVAWDQAITAYQQALALQPEQDYYDLYLGRAQMERAKLLTDAAQREQGFDDAEATLQHAHELAPLNTDHVANLARLYRTRAAMESDETKRQADVQQSSAYYEQALTLSPHSAGLYNEWAAVYLDAGQYDRAQELLQVSLNIDSEYGQTYMVMGDISLVQGQYQAAIAQYQQAVQWDSSLTAAWGRLAYAQYQLGDLNAAIATNLELLKVAPGDYETLKNLAVIYRDAGQLENALDYARQALVVAPESAQASLQQFIDEIQAVEEGAAGS